MLQKLYESFGVLAHEKQPVYSDIVPASEYYNIVTVDIPEKYPLSENSDGLALIDIDGKTYTLHDVLSNYGDSPCLTWHDGFYPHRVMLDVISRDLRR